MLFLVILLGQTMVGAKTLVKVSQGNAATHPVGKGMIYFGKRVEELTNGELEVRVYHGASLAKGDRELIEAVQAGHIEIGAATCGYMANFAPEFDIFSLPFLFNGYEHFAKCMELEGLGLETALKNSLERVGLEFLGVSTSGARQVYSKVPIETLEDLKGIKVRTMGVPTIMATFKAFGAIPVPVAFSEVYSALQSGVVDAAESSFISWINSKHIEVAPYGTRLNYMDSGRVYFINKRFYEKLPEEHKEAIKKAMEEAINDVIFGEYIKQDNEAEETARLYNAVVLHPDLEPFIQAVQVVYEEFEPTLGLEMIKRIQSTK